MGKRGPGRTRIGQPISITLTDEQKDWLIRLITPGNTLTGIVRSIIQAEMEKDKKRRPK